MTEAIRTDGLNRSSVLGWVIGSAAFGVGIGSLATR
jgi:hypothetical protein